MSAAVDYLTPLVVARDKAAPVIGSLSTHVFFSGERKIIPVKDRGSGIDPNTISVSAKKRDVSFFYDRDRGWIVLQEKVEGPLVVQIADRTGLKTTRRL